MGPGAAGEPRPSSSAHPIELSGRAGLFRDLSSGVLFFFPVRPDLPIVCSAFFPHKPRAMNRAKQEETIHGVDYQ